MKSSGYCQGNVFSETKDIAHIFCTCAPDVNHIHLSDELYDVALLEIIKNCN